MGLFARFRRKQRRTEDYVGRHRPGSWGEIALPPIEPLAPLPEAEPVETVTIAPAPAVVPAPPIPARAAVPPPVEIAARQRVRLAFADGSSLDIEDGSNDSEALMRTASRLLGDG